MRKEEFKNFFLDEEAKKYIKEMKEGKKVVIYHKIDSIYNKAIEAFRPSLDTIDQNYAMNFRSKVIEIGHKQYEQAGDIDEKELLEKLKTNKLINFLIEKKLPFTVEIEVLPSNVNVYGEPHHFNVYAKVTVNMEYLYCYYGQNYKRKIFLFTEDGVLTLKYPPYNLEDTVKNIGVTVCDETLEIVE